MDDGMMNWATPLLVLPGVGLLVMSTGVRFARLHDEMHHHLHNRPGHPNLVGRLLVRARLFRNALLALYGSACLLALAGLASGLELPFALASGLSGLGVGCLIVGCLLLMRETMVSLEVLHAEAEHMGHHED